MGSQVEHLLCSFFYILQSIRPLIFRCVMASLGSLIKSSLIEYQDSPKAHLVPVIHLVGSDENTVFMCPKMEFFHDIVAQER